MRKQAAVFLFAILWFMAQSANGFAASGAAGHGAPVSDSLQTAFSSSPVKSAASQRADVIKKYSKKSRYSFKLSDGKSQYDAFIYSDKEKKLVNDLGWACAQEGGTYYTGSYNIALIEKGSATARITQIGERSFDAEPTYNYAYLVQGKPDLIAIAACEASFGASVDLFAVVKNKAAKLKNEIGMINGAKIKAAGSQTYQSVYFSNGDDWGYFFQTWTIDKDKLGIQVKKTFHRANGGEDVLKKWLKDPAYVVTK